MSGFLRWTSAIFTVLFSLPMLLFALIQSVTGLGYPARPKDAIADQFLAGSPSFIEEAGPQGWSVGYARTVLTPQDIADHTYFIAGFLMFPAQTVTGVHDDLCVRAAVLDDGSGRGAVAFAWVDGIGLMNADVKAIREKLSDLTQSGALSSIDVGATHVHSGVDTQGLWGFLPRSGRDAGYQSVLIEKTADAIRSAYENMAPGELTYAAAAHPEMFTDSRAPRVLDENIHVFRFVPAQSDKRTLYLVNFGAHPTSYGAKNTRLSGDYIYAIEQALAKKANADLLFIQGAIGGGIGCDMSAENGMPQDDDSEKVLAYSEKMTDLILEIAQTGERVAPILNVRHAQVDVEVNQLVFKLVERARLCNAAAFRENGKILLTTEIGYVEIGKQVKILEFPGEVLPEIVYDGFLSAQDAFRKTDYPYAALNTHFDETDDVLVFGLCNDALGYFVPDNDFSASNKDGHYEETVSTGSVTASTLSAAFEALLSEVR